MLSTFVSELPDQLAALPTHLFHTANQHLNIRHFLWDTGRKNFRTVFGNQDGVLHPKVHLLVWKLYDRFYRYRLADFDRPFWQHHVMRG